MDVRNKRQEEFAEKWLSSDRRNILYLCPRFGKIRTSLNIFKGLDILHPTILVCYPDNKIRTSWENDFEKFEYENPNVTFTTYLSLKKHTSEKFDIIVLD